MKTVALAVLLAWTPVALAQTSAPPPMPAAPDVRSTKAAPAKPRRAIELSPAERAAIDARELQAVKPASVEEALQPKPDDAKIERDEANNTGANTTRIEQYRTSNRISEVVVTPAGTSRSYSMINREGRQPLGTTQMSPGLSVPNFFRFEFGRPAPAPLEAPAPPPTPGPAKPSN
ncbi:MAG TPA: hypothetical protein VNA44_04215 [Burkholderiaceae bacterium]|nr:hypothetical protein [Burkholderiaceae bacterium]